MADQFDTYRKLLALAQQHKVKTAFHKAVFAGGLAPNLDDPFSGYWRVKRADGGSPDPAATWKEGDEQVILLGEVEVRLEAVWPHAIWSPVPYEWYIAKLGGKEWPDVDETIAMLASDDPADAWRTSGEAPPSGHNAPSETIDPDSLEAIKAAVAKAKPSLAKYAEITSDEMRDAAQSLRSIFLDPPLN